jgi:hypothetical protein
MPYANCQQAPAQASVEPSGVGTELKKLLARVGIRATPGCKCNARARVMDQNGPEWCRQNIEVICAWLNEEATARRLPFSQMLAKAMVSAAISRAEKKAASVPDNASSTT